MLEKRNRKHYVYSIEYLESSLLNSQGTEQINGVTYDPERGLVHFYTSRLCIEDHIEPTIQGQCSPVTADGYYSLSEESESVTSHDQEISDGTVNVCKCTIPNKNIHARCCTCVQDESRGWQHCPTHGLLAQTLFNPNQLLPQPGEPTMDLLVDETVYPWRRNKKEDKKIKSISLIGKQKVIEYTDGTKKKKRVKRRDR